MGARALKARENLGQEKLALGPGRIVAELHIDPKMKSQAMVMFRRIELACAFLDIKIEPVLTLGLKIPFVHLKGQSPHKDWQGLPNISIELFNRMTDLMAHRQTKPKTAIGH
jgi:hypothetical protein